MSENPDKPIHTDVLIAGAGPAGLMMACQLALHQVSFRIIERTENFPDFSGALLIQARTLEIFDQMGLANKALEKGAVVENIRLIHNGRKSGTLSIGNMGSGLSRFPYILMLKQTHTRKLLSGFLEERGISVEQGTSLDQFSQEPQGVNTVLKLADGKKENLKVRYLIGADGIHSKVRKGLGIRWEGSRDPIPLFVTDCQVKEEPGHAGKEKTTNLGKPANNIIFSISQKSIAGFFPLEGKSWRIDGLIPEGTTKQQAFDFEDATRDLAGKLKMKLALQKPDWFSVFYPNTYLASTYQTGRCFLVGDAAHVHTPIGAQGMNTGLQDSYNLAWKMAYVLKHRASEGILNTYTQERRPVAARLIQSTDKYFSLAIRKDMLSRAIRNYLLPWSFRLFSFLLETKKVQRAFFRRISQTAVGYGSTSSWTGKRWPFIEWTDAEGNTRDTHALLDGIKFTLVYFQKGKPGRQETEAAFHSHTASYNLPVNVKEIADSKETKDIFQRLGVSKSTYFMIRPDGYIALHGQDMDLKPVDNYLSNLISSQGELSLS
jgi:2-polyprenyl-6-methoxyphenol hydroxylase-like FAD-dependent oxidoreductase